MQGANQLTYITHFIIIPANGSYQLRITYRLHLGLCSIEQGTETNTYNIAATQTKVQTVGDTQLVRTVSWYDNEMSYVSQLVRTLHYFAKLIK